MHKPNDVKSKSRKDMQHEDEDISDEDRFLRGALGCSRARDKTGGAVRLLLTDNNHMLPTLITLILSQQGQDQSNTHTHTDLYR